MRATNFAILAALAWFGAGCDEAPKGDTPTSPAVSTPEEPAEQAEQQGSGEAVSPPNEGDEVAVIETNLGRIVVKFFPDKAPGHVKNFKDLANKKFYDGTKFHRVIPGFMIQGGDPNTKSDDRTTHGMGDPGYKIKAEFNDVKHVRGILSTARGGDPDSAGSQFFLMHAAYPSLDGQYTVFGMTVVGLDVIDKIVNLARDGSDNPLPANPAIVKTVRIEKWPLK